MGQPEVKAPESVRGRPTLLALRRQPSSWLAVVLYNASFPHHQPILLRRWSSVQGMGWTMIADWKKAMP